MNANIEHYEHLEIAFLHGSANASRLPIRSSKCWGAWLSLFRLPKVVHCDSCFLQQVLGRVVEFVSAVVHCDSCFLYVLEDGGLVLRASKNPHPEVIDRIKLRMGQGITGWVAEQREPVAIASNAFQDPRFQSFSELPEDHYEAFLSVPVLCRDKVVVINLQHRQPHVHTQREMQLISTIGFLVGPEIEMARLEAEKLKSSELSEARKLVEQAVEVLERDLDFSQQEAYRVMQKQSRHSGKSMKEVASAVLLYDELTSVSRNAKSS